MKLEKNQHHQAAVVDLNSSGMGVAKIDGFPIFVDGTIPGEKIELRITKLKKSYGYGRLIKVIEAHPNRVEIRDDLGRQTGTMGLQHIKYSMQLRLKKQIVQDAFQRIGGFENIQIQATIGMVNPWEYRNKAQVPVREIDGRLETGYFRRGTNDLIPMEKYHIQHPQIDETINTVRDILRKYQIQAYNPKNNSGHIRHIIVKRGYHTGEIMIVLVTRHDQIPKQEEIIEEIVDQVPDLVSLTQNINTQKTNRILGRDTKVLWGRDYYIDEILGLKFKISTKSFFQVNTQGAEMLYYKAIEMAKIKDTDVVLDAYCGLGSITLNLARKAKKVYGVEIVEEAIEMAKENARLNDISNVHFQAGPAEKVLHKWKDQGIDFDIAFVDPPRKGLDPDFIQTMIDMDIEKIVYISCNPSTQARDCKILTDHGYKIKKIQPVDMFPMTHHVECIALIQREIM